MPPVVFTLRWEKDSEGPGDWPDYCRCTWTGPHGPIHTFAMPENHPGQHGRLATENTAIAMMVKMMSEEALTFTHLEIDRG